MMKIASLTFLFITLIFSATKVFAHPPDSLQMSFDSTGTILSIRVFHAVKIDNHYINQVTVNLNGKEIIKQSIKSQSSKTEQFLFYKIIDIKQNDKIEVIAHCNVFGKKKHTLIYKLSKN